MIDAPTIGNRLKFFRKRNGISQFDLELESGLATGVLSKIELGKINPTKESVIKIAEVLNLNDLEVSYLIGKYAQAATDKEIQLALEETKTFFENPDTLAFLLDDRSRLLAISKGFCILGEITEELKKPLMGTVLSRVILDDELGMSKFFKGEQFESSAYNIFYRTFEQINFMQDDEYYIEMIKWIRNDPTVNKIWTEFEKSHPSRIRTEESRVMYFSFQGQSIKVIFTDEILPKYPRFRVLYYKPTKVFSSYLKTNKGS